MSLKNQPLIIAGRMFRSRLILGTGKFSSPEAMRDALVASGAEMVTVALRRADLSGKRDPFANILEFIDAEKFLLLPNTSGAMNADEAVRLARLAVAAGLPKWVKLEIHPDPRFLLPDPIETFKAAEILVAEGFTVLPYINADPVLAKRLQDIGVATVMPLGSPIGSNRGIQTREPDGFLGTHRAAGVGQQQKFFRVNEFKDVGERVFLPAQIGAAQGYGHEFRAAGFEGIAHRFGRGKFSRA